MNSRSIDINNYIGLQIPKPVAQHVDMGSYLGRLSAAEARFDHLAEGLDVVHFRGADLASTDYKVYDKIELGDYHVGKRVRGVQGVKPVFARLDYRVLNPHEGNERRQISLWTDGDRLLGAHSIESGHNFVTSINSQKLDKFNSLIGEIALLNPAN
jgi:hypothetical protein